MYSTIGLSHQIIPDKLVHIYESQVASLPVEGIGIHGSYHLKGFAAISNSYIIEVSINGLTSISSNPVFGDVNYFGNVSLFINGVNQGKKNLVNQGNPILLPDDGTKHIGEVQFDISYYSETITSIDVEVEGGYIHSSNATPIPSTNKFLVNLYKKKEESISLFLIDVSGSMNDNNKFGQAKQSAFNTLNTIEHQSRQVNQQPKIGLMTYSGGCSESSARVVQPFTPDLNILKQSISSIPYPGGGTPLPFAIKKAKEELLKELNSNGQSCGSLIILGDGQSSCGQIRPPNAYAGIRKENICKNNVTGSPAVKYFTVGFGIAPGSEAERDLQYLAATSGGKYFNAKNEYQLTRAFQKINRIYNPIVFPQTKNLTPKANSRFYSGIDYIGNEQYDSAMVAYKKYVTEFPKDSSGLYNMAIMCEANERYKAAGKYYNLYLKQAPNAPNRAAIQERILTLEKDYKIFLAYMREYLITDIEYLDIHRKQLMHTPNSVPLAGEFAGFIKEKYVFYAELSEILEMDEAWVERYSKEISQAFRLAIFFLKSNPKRWDLDGIAMIGNIHYPLEKLVKKMKK